MEHMHTSFTKQMDREFLVQVMGIQARVSADARYDGDSIGRSISALGADWREVIVTQRPPKSRRVSPEDDATLKAKKAFLSKTLGAGKGFSNFTDLMTSLNNTLKDM